LLWFVVRVPGTPRGPSGAAQLPQRPDHLQPSPDAILIFPGISRHPPVRTDLAQRLPDGTGAAVLRRHRRTLRGLCGAESTAAQL